MRTMPTSILLAFFCLSTAAQARNPIIEKVLNDQQSRIPREAMLKALDYYESHPDKVQNKAYVTIVDFNLASTEKRMHVIDMKTGDVEDLLVAHGKNSGNNYATSFSNTEGTLKSSLGIYLTAEQYTGKHGVSLRLDGMEPTNSNIRKRDIVMHGATYVSQETINKIGRIGKSWGCLAVPQPMIERLVGQLKGGSVILVYRGTGPEAGRDKDDKIESHKDDE